VAKLILSLNISRTVYTECCGICDAALSLHKYICGGHSKQQQQNTPHILPSVQGVEQNIGPIIFEP
jgi:hypothetical protein